MAETSLECINRNLIGSLNVVTLCIEYSSRVQMCQADSGVRRGWRLAIWVDCARLRWNPR